MRAAVQPASPDTHIDFLAAVHGVWAWFNALIGLAMAAYAASAAVLATTAGIAAAGAELAAALTAGGFLVVGLTALFWAGVHAWCAAALRRRDRRARLVALGLSLFNAALFPFGTLLAGYTLWVLLRAPVRARFEPAGEAASSR